MRRAFVRCVLALGCVWSIKNLGCDPASTSGSFVDTDGDGLSDIDETTLYGTSPLLADTDGDGMTDNAEITQHAFDPANAPLLFNPRVADVPDLNLEITGPPLISLIMTDTNGVTQTFTVSQTQGESVTDTVGTTTTNRQSNTVGESDTVSREDAVSRNDTLSDALSQDGNDDADAAVSEQPDAGTVSSTPDRGGPIMVTLSRRAPSTTTGSTTNGATSTVGGSTTYDQSYTTEIQVAFTQEESREVSQALTVAQSYAQDHSIELSGGILEVLVVLRNRGTIPFQVTNLTLAASFLTDEGIEVPVGNLEINTRLTSFDPYSLAPGQEAGPVNFSRETLTLDQVASLFRNVSGLIVRVGVYELSDGDGKPYVFDVPTVQSRTATISIDYGGEREPERHLVATNLDPSRPGVTAKRALEDVLRLPIVCDPDAGSMSVRDVASSNGGSGHWCLYYRRVDSDGDDATTPYCGVDAAKACSNLVLRAGDVLQLTWVEK